GPDAPVTIAAAGGVEQGSAEARGGHADEPEREPVSEERCVRHDRSISGTACAGRSLHDGPGARRGDARHRIRMRSRLPLLVAAGALVAMLASSTAHAYERQWHAGASFGYMGGWNGPGHGLGGGLDLGYGVRDWLDLVGAADVTYHPSTKLLVPTVTAGV